MNKFALPERRAELGPTLAAAFPDVAGRGAQISPIRGGLSAAIERLCGIDPIAYAKSRNFLDGAVTGLSPYLRHGVLTLTAVLQAVVRDVRQVAQAEKLITELAWRDYYQRVYAVIGPRVWDDLEGYKTGWTAGDYADELPADVQDGQTGLACMDGFAADLRSTGYLHNHARMWVAAYVVHHRRVKWQEGARWFLHHLLDGDMASNNLSWQWVASVFSHKPYIFNRENLERYTGGRYCAECPARQACPFEGDYESLAGKLFPRLADGSPPSHAEQATALRAPADPLPDAKPVTAMVDAVAWVHEDALRPSNPALLAAGGARSLTVLDEAYFVQQDYSLKRVAFIAESAGQTGAQVVQGPVAEAIVAFARANSARRVVTTATLNPALRGVIEQLRKTLPVNVIAEPGFVTLTGPVDLTRFSRYWRKAERQLVK